MSDTDALSRQLNSGNALPEGVTISCLAEKPLLILGLIWPDGWRDFDDFILSVIVQNHAKRLSKDSYIPRFRCTEIERLPYILAHGCDVVPTNAVLWVDMLPSKALEYGGETKVLMVFDGRKMKNSGQEVQADIQPEELERLQTVYPTVLRTTDGQSLWLSRLPESDRRVGGMYESEHGRWIPGDPWEALRLVIVLAHELSSLPNLIEARAIKKTNEILPH